MNLGGEICNNFGSDKPKRNKVAKVERGQDNVRESVARMARFGGFLFRCRPSNESAEGVAFRPSNARCLGRSLGANEQQPTTNPFRHQRG